MKPKVPSFYTKDYVGTLGSKINEELRVSIATQKPLSEGYIAYLTGLRKPNVKSKQKPAVIVNENDAQIIWGAAGRFDRISLEGLFDLCHSIESVARRELKHDKKFKEKIEHCLEDEEDWMITRADYKFLMAAKDCREMCANTIMFWIRKLGHANGEPIYMMGPYAHLVANTHVMLGHEDVIYSFHNVSSIVDNPGINTLPICMFDNERKLVMKDYYEFIEEMKCRFPDKYRFDN